MPDQHYTPEQSINEGFHQIIGDARARRKDLLLAHLSSSYGRRIPKAKLEHRADLILRYKNMGPLWIQKTESKEVVWVKKCLDFAYPGLFMRCLGKDDELLVFDPDRITIETDTERSCRVSEQTLSSASRELKTLQETLRNTRAYAEVLEKRIEALGEKLERTRAYLARAKVGNQKRTYRRWFPISP